MTGRVISGRNRKTVDVGNLLRDEQGQNGPETGDCPEEMTGHRALVFGLPSDLRFDSELDPVVDIEEMQVRLDAFARAGFLEPLLESGPV